METPNGSGMPSSGTFSTWYANWTLRYGRWLKLGLDFYKLNLSLLYLLALATTLLTSISFGLLGGPMLFALFVIVFRLMSEPGSKPEANEIFQIAYKNFLNPFLLYLALIVVTIVVDNVLFTLGALGFLLAIVFNIALFSLLLFALPLMADRNLPFTAAALQSADLVKKDFLGFLLFGFVIFVASYWGVLIFFSWNLLNIIIAACLSALTFPAVVAAVAVAYRELFPPAAAVPGDVVEPSV